MANWELQIGRRQIDRAERAKYNRFFAPAKNTDITVNRGADIPTTVNQIKVIVADTLAQTKDLAAYLARDTNDIRVIASRIHHFLWSCFDYDEKEVESNEELLREPIRIWADEKGDCDCFTILTSSILSNLQIPHFLRIAKYETVNLRGFKEVGDWQHIYVIVPTDSKYITIDGVLSQFSGEYPYHLAQDYNIMATHRLGNVPAGNTNNDQATKEMFQSMLNMVNENPEDALNFGYSNAENLKKMLQYALDNWDKDKAAVLEILAQEEANMNTLNGLSGSLGNVWDEGYDEAIEEEMQYLRGLGAVLKKKAAPKPAALVKKVAAKVAPKKNTPAPKVTGKKTTTPAPKAATPKVQPQKKNFFQKVKEKVTQGDGKFDVKDAGHLFKKVPMAPARLVILLTIKANLLKLKDDLKGNPTKYAKFEKAWVSIGGEKKALNDAVFGKGTVKGVLGYLGNLGEPVTIAATAAAGAAPAAGFLAANSDLFKKINIKDIVTMLTSLFKKKEDKENPDVKAKGDRQEDFGTEGDMQSLDEPTPTGEGGNAAAIMARKTAIIDKDSDGKDDETGYVYLDANNDGLDDSTGITIKKGKKNFFVENPLITGGIILGASVAGWAVWKFVIQKEDGKPKALSGAPKKRKESNEPKRLPIMA